MAGFVHTITAKAFAGFLFLAIVFGAGLFFIYRTLDDLDPAVQAIREPNSTIRIWRETNNNSNNAITFMRRYLLTGDTTMLVSFQQSRERIDEKLDSLRLLAGGDSMRVRRADTLQLLLDRKLEESTLGAVASAENSEMSVAIDKAVQQLAVMERKREQQMEKQEEIHYTQRKDTLVVTKNNEPAVSEKDNFFQRILGKRKKKSEQDTTMSIEQIANMLDSIIVADTVTVYTPAAITDTLNRALVIANELTNAKTRDFEARELELKEELRLLAQRRSTDSLIAELTVRMHTAEQETTADLISAASGQVRTSTGNIFVVLIVGALALILLFTVIIRADVSRSAKLREKIEEARRNAEQLAKTREDFAANMSHEIRSPLNSIMGISEQLSKNPGPGNQKLVEGLLSSAQHLLGLINPVLDVTKLNSGKIEFEVQPFNLHETLIDVQRAFRISAAEKVIGLDLNINSTVPVWVLGDDVRLRQIMFNLVGNAIKFTDKGHVKIACTDLGAGVDGRHRIQFKVSDTGIGIESSSLERIFDEYSQANSGITRKFGGTGLGLSISRKLIEQQEGTITVRSEPGKGSDFIFEIPFAVADRRRTTELVTAVSQDLAGKKILVCDDEEMNRMLAGMIIANYGGKVVECGSGEEVLERIRHEDFDLMLLDINLPGIDGKSTLAAVRALGKNIPVIAVTGNAHEEPLFKRAGFNAIIIKPYQESDLLEVIHKYAFADSTSRLHQVPRE
jgi:signal transduction histidine kinase/CHASE3 domain sensor protein